MTTLSNDTHAPRELRWRAADRWQLGVAADAGSGGSQLSADLSTSMSYRLSSRWIFYGAYRWLHLDHSEDAFRFQGHLSGPMLGVAYRG